VCEYEVNLLTNEKVNGGKRNFNAKPDSPIYKPKFSSKNPAYKANSIYKDTTDKHNISTGFY